MIPQNLIKYDDLHQQTRAWCPNQYGLERRVGAGLQSYPSMKAVIKAIHFM